MAEFADNTTQTVNPGELIKFSLNPVPCDRGFVRWHQGTGAFNLSGWVPNRYSSCCCKRAKNALYLAVLELISLSRLAKPLARFRLHLNLMAQPLPRPQ